MKERALSPDTNQIKGVSDWLQPAYGIQGVRSHYRINESKSIPLLEWDTLMILKVMNNENKPRIICGVPGPDLFLTIGTQMFFTFHYLMVLFISFQVN